MEFKINKNILEKALSSVVKIIPPKSTYTVLQNVIIEAKGHNLSIEATDLDIFIRKTITAEVKEPGKVLIPGKKILEITRESNTEEIGFRLKELNFQISCGNAKFNIPSLDSQEFPEIPKFPEKRWFEITLGEMQEMVDATIFMVAKDISRRPMNGVLVQLKGGELRLISTDGARLALVKREKKETSGELIISTKVFDLLEYQNPEEKLEVYIDERMVGFKFLDSMVIARLIEGPYPNYEGVIPKSYVGTCAIDKNVLEGGLKRVSLVASPHIKNVKFDFAEKGINLSASSPDIGEAREDVACHYEGEKMGLWFNANFMLEILRHVNDEVVLQLTSQSTAATMKPKSNDHLLYLLMPLRIDNYE